MNARSIFSLVALSVALNPVAHAGPPVAQQVLGPATFVTMEVKQLANPKLIYVNKELMEEKGLTPQKIIDMVGYAAPVSRETPGGYTNKTKTAYADGYGGIGLNGNGGNGRTFTVEQTNVGSELAIWENKGGGITPHVNAGSDTTHRNGASALPEGIHEAVWGNLLAAELPGGAFRTLAIISTGTRIDGAEGEPRVLIIREAPIRPAHFVINPHMEEKNDPRDKARIEEAMERLVNALPQPANSRARTEGERFRSGIMEMIDRQAIMHSYAWAHSLFHGGTSPSNAGLDGRALDFGTYQALDGYQKIRVIHDDGHNGETEVYKRDLLKDIRDSWVRTLPKRLLRELPSEKEWFERFDATYLKTQQTEMLRLAGAFNEFAADLHATRDGLALSNLLMEIALAGNEKQIEKWKGEEYLGRGTYKLGAVLGAIAEMNLNSPADSEKLQQALPDSGLRAELIKLYTSTFRKQVSMANYLGISANAEGNYRRLATNLRNKKMSTIFSKVENEQKIWDVLAEFKEKGDTGAAQRLIDQRISENRRDFHDAKPFTLVLGEKVIEGKTKRKVFDALIDRVIEVASPKEKAIRGAVRGGSCKDIFPEAI